MNPKATSREDILEACRAIVRERGLSGISVRSVASACGIAPGTLYNYFPGKDALVLAVTADIWRDIFGFDAEQDPSAEKEPDAEQGFAAYVEKTFQGARRGMARYPGFLPAHALGLAGNDAQSSLGQEMMRSFFGRIEDGLLRALNADGNVRQDAFSDVLTREDLAELVTQQLVLLLVLGRDDCQSLVALVRRVLY
jgi:AcrR family transcriptional regulator